MPLRALDLPTATPWLPSLRGTLDRLVVESEVLSENPLGDSRVRGLDVYRSPGLAIPGALETAPTIYVVAGEESYPFDGWLGKDVLLPNFLERLDARLATAGREALVVLFDARTSRGPSRCLNSRGTGPYMDYLCDEIIPFVDERYPSLAQAEHRGLLGIEAGGYAALVVPMLRPDVFGACAAHNADALFESCYRPHFPTVARELRDHFDGSFEVFRDRIREVEYAETPALRKPFEIYGDAAVYSPDPDHPGEVRLPFEISTGRALDEVWSDWLEHDPVRMAPAHAHALVKMRGIHLSAWNNDVDYRDLAAQAFAQELSRIGVDHALQLLDAEARSGYRYTDAVLELVDRLD